MRKYIWESNADGELSLEAASLEAAIEKAKVLVLDGDWPEEGCDIELFVRHESEEDWEWCDHEFHIQSKEEILKEALEESGVLVAENEHEYSTEKIYHFGDEYYYIVENGGDRGAYDRMGGDGVWRDHPIEPATVISKSEVICKLLDWGIEPEEIKNG